MDKKDKKLYRALVKLRDKAREKAKTLMLNADGNLIAANDQHFGEHPIEWSFHLRYRYHAERQKNAEKAINRKLRRKFRVGLVSKEVKRSSQLSENILKML